MQEQPVKAPQPDRDLGSGHSGVLWFTEHHTLLNRTLHRENVRYLGIEECEALGNLLTNSESKLQRLEVCKAQLDDERMICLGNALAINKTLQYLDLYINDESISLEGWQGLSRCLRNPDTALETLRFSDSTDDDNEAATDKVSAMVRALEGNSTLENLHVGCTSHGYDINITDKWVW